MARVPESYPSEPGATRCGDTYLDIIVVNGEIPGTDFGRQFTETIEPVWFRDGTTKKVPLFTSSNDVRKELRRPGGVQDRLKRFDQTFEIYDHLLNSQEEVALRRLIDYAWVLLDKSVAEGNGGKSAQKRVREALQHLRCAEYWLTRVKLVDEAKKEYQPGPVLLGEEEPYQRPFRPPPESELPPIDEDEGEDKKKKAAPKKKYNTLLYLGGLGLAVAGYVWYKKKK